ncbi:pilin, partial [Patescibacteria group bacterium]|nr:pilin [Patescibacteria group bacterium]
MEGKNKNKSFWWFFTGVVISFLGVLAVTLLVSDTAVAQVGTGNFGPTFGLGTADLQSTIINIVQWALGFLGLVAVIMIIYGGFVWMTAGGNQEKVAKAKKIITRAVIGLVIVLLAWAIVLWVFNFINDVTNPPAPCTDGDVRLPCELCVGGVYVWQFSWDSCGTGTTPFYVEMVDPGENETNVVLCSMVQAVFNDEIDQTTIDPDPNTGNVRVVVFGGAIGGTPCVQNKECFSGVCTAGQCVGEVVSGAWSVFNTPEPKGILYYQADDDYIENTWSEVQLLPGIASLNAALSPFTGKVWQFETGSETLEFPPTVTQIYPFDAENGICLSTAIQAKFSSKMMLPSMTHRMCSGGNDACDLDADCPAAETCEGTILLEAIAPVVPTALGGVSYPNFQSFSTRPAELLEPGRQYNVTLKAGVPGTFFGIQDVCGNHLDGDYNQMDDGSPGDNFMGVVPPDPPGGIPPWDFTADTDTTNTICLPEITSINPSNGMYDNAAGNVDITGSNFGITGKVYFNKKVININTCFDGTEFPGFGDCVSAWTPTSITVHTPGGPILFPDNEPSIGAKDGPVTVDVSPGVCVGGANDGRSCNIPADCPDGTCRSDSNGMGFDVISAQITEVSGRGGLEHGGIGQYVSIIKRNDGNGGFGDIKGKVFFRKLSPPIIGDEIEAPFPPDPPCTETWFDDYIVIKVPDMGSTGQTTCDTSVFNWWECPAAYDVGIQVEKSDGTRSNIIKFHYTDELPGPGVCNIAPQNCGTNPEPRTLQGEEFQSYDAVESKVLFQLGFDPEVEANVPNPAVDWDNLFVNFEVPNIDNAKGYRVWLKNPVDFSNRLPFNVPCGAIPEVVEDSSCGARCDAMAPNPGAPCTTNFDCANFPCNIDMASPHPWPNLQDVCLNAAFG